MTNLQLSAEEMQLVSNREWILTKHRIIEKVYGLFGSLSAQMQLYLQEHPHILPAQVLQLPPKISKGEQYKALPYVVLDYPRLFSKEDVFAIRSFFWWGHYFSITLHLKGKFHRQYHKKITDAVADKRLQDFYFSFSGNEFSFNLPGRNYFFYDGASHYPGAAAGQEPFLKISYKISFEHWDTAEQRLKEAFERFISLPRED